MDATTTQQEWRSTRESGWSKPRWLYELQNGWPYRTWPPNIPIDWHSPEVERTFDVTASTVTFTRDYKVVPGPILQLGIDRPTVEIRGAVAASRAGGC